MVKALSTISDVKKVSLEAYFKAEEKSLTKNEYHNGIVTPMAGGKLPHNTLANRAGAILEFFNFHNKLGHTVSNSDTKIRIEAFNKVVYPDAVVICQTPQYFEHRKDTITNPLVVVEVLSASTQKYDRTTKFEMYRTLPSFKEYVLIYQDIFHVTVWTKQDNDAWLPKDYTGKESVAILNAFQDCPLSLEHLYQGF